MAKMAKAVGFGREASPTATLPAPGRAAAPAPDQGSDLWDGGERELELPERRLFRRRRGRYVGSHREAANGEVEDSTRKRRSRRDRSRNDFGFGG
jgi:hypothetical protein